VGKGACAVPTANTPLEMVGTLRFAHPTIPAVIATEAKQSISPDVRNDGLLRRYRSSQ
jgi:hypothetical protein